MGGVDEFTSSYERENNDYVQASLAFMQQIKTLKNFLKYHIDQ